MAPSSNRRGDTLRVVAGMPRVTTIVAAALATMFLAAPSPAADSADDHFEAVIRPLLVERCHACHAGAEAKAGLRLDSRAGLVRGPSERRPRRPQ